MLTRLSVRSALFVVVAAALLTLSACSVQVDDKKADGKKLDIQTPMGNLHVSEQANVADTGLSVYPGASQKAEDDSSDKKRANVNISTKSFALKVVALEYESNDTPAKLVAYYTNELKKFGKVIECHESSDNTTLNFGDSNDKSSDNPEDKVTCGKNDGGDSIELKTGSKGSQHIVAIKPRGKGTDFGLVYVRIHKDAAI